MWPEVKNRSEIELNLVIQARSAYRVVRAISTKVWSACGKDNIQQTE
jgi:hypothetical protein